MVARLLVGIVAALHAVLITGQVERLSSQPLSWPTLRLPRALPTTPADRDHIALKAPPSRRRGILIEERTAAPTRDFRTSENVS